MEKTTAQKKRGSLDYSNSLVELLDEWPAREFFGVSLLKNGKTARLESENFKELKSLVDNAGVSWVNCCVEDLKVEALSISKFFGFEENLVNELLQGKSSAYLDLNTELGLLLPAVKVRNLSVQISPILILMNKNTVLSIHGRRVTRFMRFLNYAEVFLKKIPKKTKDLDKVTVLLTRLLDKVNEKNFENLRLIEDEGARVSKMLVSAEGSSKEIGAEIYAMKQTLIHYLGALWASVDVVNGLRYGDSALISDDKSLLAEISSLASEIKTNIALGEHTSEVLASGLEVMQSIYNNQLQILNNRLALVVTWLTVIGTAVLVPNTLATLLGIPAINKNLDGLAIILILVFSTIVAAVLSYWFIKKIMPSKIE